LARFSWLPGGLAAAFIIVVGRLISSATYAPVELMLYDRVMRATPAPSGADIAVIAIDDASISKLGEWPWPRDVHASLISRLTGAGARVVAFSVPVDTSPRTSEAERLRSALALLESSDLGGSQQAQELRRLLGESSAGRDPDAHLAQAIEATAMSSCRPMSVSPRSVVVSPNCRRELLSSGRRRRDERCTNCRQSSQRLPSVLTQAAAAIGHTLTVADGDRNASLGRRGGSQWRRSNSCHRWEQLWPRAALRRARLVELRSADTLHLNERSGLLGPALTIRPHYLPTQPSQFAQYPYWSVLAGDIPAEQLRDKIVIVGFLDSDACRARYGDDTRRATRRRSC
jgi:serine/threonine-protein kinase